MDKHELMKLTPLFMGLSEAERAEIAQQFSVDTCASNQSLFSAGDPSDALYLVAEGFVRLTTPQGQSLATMGPGSVLGEASLFQNAPYDASAVAASDVKYLRLTDGELRALLLANPAIGIQLSQNFGALVVQMQDFLIHLLSQTDEMAGLPRNTLETVAAHLEPVHVEAQQTICRAGEVAQGLLIVESGSIEVDDETTLEDDDPTQWLTSGSILGAAPLLTNKPYSYTAVVAKPGRLWRLAAEDFQTIAARNPGLRRSLGRSVRTRLGRADQAQATARLANMPMFAQLPQPIIEAIAQRMVLQYAPAGERVFRIGDAGDAVYFIEHGEVELTAENASGVVEELARVGDEGFFGEQSIFSGQIRTEDATATRNTNLWVLHKADLDAVAAQYPAIGKALSEAIATRLATENSNTDLDRFRQFSLFAGLNDDDLAQIVPYMEPDRYRAGEQILRASMPPERLFLIDQGQIRVQALSGASWALGAGQTLGEQALLNNQPHNVSAMASTDVDVWSLSKPDFDLLLARHPHLAINISRMLSQRLEQQDAPMTQAMGGEGAYAPPMAGAQRQQYATDPMAGPPKKRGGFGQWYGNLSGWGKVRLALLILLILWIIAVAAPWALINILQATGLRDGDSFAVSSSEALQAVYKLGSYDVAAQDATLAQQVAMVDNQVAPTATYTPPPTRTSVPTATPLPTNTPLPPTATPTPAPIVFAAQAAPVVEEAPVEEIQAASAPPRSWDSRLDQLGVYVEDAQVAPGQQYWRLVDAAWWNEEESRGKHHIYVEVLDENGERIVGHPVTVFWGDGSHTGRTEDKAPPDYAFNYQMYAAGNAYSVEIGGLPSDVLKGAGMGSIEDRFRGNHTSFLLVYQKATK